MWSRSFVLRCGEVLFVFYPSEDVLGVLRRYVVEIRWLISIEMGHGCVKSLSKALFLADLCRAIYAQGLKGRLGWVPCRAR